MESIQQKYLVSKNVCHGVVYDLEFHQKMEAFKDANQGLNLIYRGMKLYLKKKPEGKKFHDPLAACVAIEPNICEFREVKMQRQKGGWGAILAQGTHTYISIKVDKTKFFEVFTKN